MLQRLVLYLFPGRIFSGSFFCTHPSLFHGIFRSLPGMRIHPFLRPFCSSTFLQILIGLLGCLFSGGIRNLCGCPAAFLCPSFQYAFHFITSIPGRGIRMVRCVGYSGSLERFFLSRKPGFFRQLFWHTGSLFQNLRFPVMLSCFDILHISPPIRISWNRLSFWSVPVLCPFLDLRQIALQFLYRFLYQRMVRIGRNHVNGFLIDLICH